VFEVVVGGINDVNAINLESKEKNQRNGPLNLLQAVGCV
jgi:hypothetical protein